MDEFISYWGIVASALTAASASVLYFIKNWRDVEALKEQRRIQDLQLAALLEKVDAYQMAGVDRERKFKQAVELKLQEQRAELGREAATGRREGTTAVLRLNERVDSLDKQLTVSVERLNQLLDSTRRQELRNERVDKMLWSRGNARLSEE